MCTRGVFQLRKLSLFFCDFGGSSQGVRNALTKPQLTQFMTKNPHIQFSFICKRNHHPFVTGVYINGYAKDMPLRSLSWQDVLETFATLRNQIGRKSYAVSGPRTYHPVKSIQGKWQPNMFNKYPQAELQTVHPIRSANFEMVEKTLINRSHRKHEDMATRLLRLKDYQGQPSDQ